MANQFRFRSSHLAILVIVVLIVLGGALLYFRSNRSSAPYSPSVIPTSALESSPMPSNSQTTLPGTITSNQIGYVGCSNTQLSVEGYHAVSGNKDLFWPIYNSFSESIERWAQNNSDAWQRFGQAERTSGTPTVVWVQICEQADRHIATYEDVKNTLSNLKQLLPHAVVYLSPINSFSSLSLCPKIGTDGADGREHEINFTDQAVREGLALRGPDLGPLGPGDTKGGCHPNAQGMQKIGTQLVNFFDHL